MLCFENKANPCFPVHSWKFHFFFLQVFVLFLFPPGEHVDALWFSSDNAEHSSKVKGALEGEARQKMWDEQQQFVTRFHEPTAAEGGEDGAADAKRPKVDS